MWDLVYSWVMLVKVIFLFAMLFFFIPMRVLSFDQDNNSFLDKIFISLIHSVMLTEIIVHILAFLRIYESFSLVFSYFVSFVIFLWIKGRTPGAFADSLGMKFVVNLLDLSEGRLGLFGELKEKFLSWFFSTKEKLYVFFRYLLFDPFGGFLTLLVCTGAIYIRFKHSMTHLYLGASDSYVHLAWTKYLGSNNIYQDGIYPHGYHAIISAMNKLFFLDTYYVIRFIGPFAGFLIVLSVFYFAKKIFRDVHVALIAIFLFGLVTDSRILTDVWRQMSGLPQEFSTIFFLPGVYFFHCYVKSKKTEYLLLSAECVSLTLIIHPYVTVFLALSYVLVFILYLFKNFTIKEFIKLVGFMVGSVFLGLLPLLIGLVTGNKFHTSLAYVQRNVKIPDVSEVQGMARFMEHSLFLNVMLASTAIGLIIWLVGFLLKRRQENSKEIFSIIIITFVFYISFRAPRLGLPVLMEPGRIGMFLALLGVCVVGLAVKIVDIFPFKKGLAYGIKSMISIIILFLVFQNASFKIPQGYQLEYDEAVYAYLQIKKEFPVLNWTIIAPVEQYQQCMGYGWHVELCTFIEEVCEKKKGNYKIPTDYIFLFVEKVPFGSTKQVSTELKEKPFPTLIGNDPSDFYYRKVENREIIESKAYYWAEDFKMSHKNVETFLETPKMKVYMISQNAEEAINLSQ